MKGRKTYLIVIVLIFIIQQMVSKVGGVIANLFDYQLIDKDNVFAWISIHHLVQLSVSLVIITILSKCLKLDFKFKFGNVKVGLTYVAVFTLIMLVYVLFIYLTGYYFGQISSYHYELNFINMMGILGFQLLLSGSSEEILFRALPITVLLHFWEDAGRIKIGQLSIPLEIFIAALLFSMAHISWSLNPLCVQANYFQVAYAFLLGIAYGFAYRRSEGILYPIVMHSISNVLMVGVGYVFAILL